MLRNHQSKLVKAVWAVAPAASLLVFVHSADAATWIDGAGSWNSTANWAGTPNPPTGDLTVNSANTGSFLNSGSWAEADIGNNGTVTLGGVDTGIMRLRLGYAYPGATNPGTGVLNIDSGTVATDQDNVIGDGASGTLNISGGMFYTKDTKHTFLAAFNDSQINLSGGAMVLSRSGIEKVAGFGTIDISGGVVDFYNLPSALNNAGAPTTLITTATQLNVDWISFTGGNIGGLAGIRTLTINHVAGNGSIDFQVNTGSAATFDIEGESDTWGGTAGQGSVALAANEGQLIKIGSGALTLTGSQSYLRSTSVSGGTLILDYSAAANAAGGMLNDASTISMGGGTLVFRGNTSAPASELIGKLGATAGGSKIIFDDSSGQGFTLDTRSSAGTSGFNRSVGATLDFNVIGGTFGTGAGSVNILATTAGTNGMIGGYATVNNYTEWAANKSGTILPFAAYDTTDTDLGQTATDPTKNLEPSGSQSAVTNSVQFNSIHLTGTEGITMTGSGSIALTTGGLLINDTSPTAISGGTLTGAQTTGADVVITNTSDATMSSVVVDNGGSIGLTKNGPATLIVSATQSYSGPTTVDGGTLRLGIDNPLPNNGTLTLSNTPGAVFDLNGLTATFSGLTGGGTAGGEIKLGTGTFTLQNGGSITYGGIFSGPGNLVKSNGGVATFSNGSSSYTGVTTINNGGTLTVVALGNGGTVSSIGAASSNAANIVLDNGDLRFAGRNTTSTDRLFAIGPGGGTIESFGFNESVSGDGMYGILHMTNTGTIGMVGSPSQRTLNFAGASAPQVGSLSSADVNNLFVNTFAPIIPDDGVGQQTTVQKNGSDEWDLLGSNTYTGQTIINGGQVGTSSVASGTLGVNSLPNGGMPSPIGASTSDPNNLQIQNGGALRYTGAGASTDRLFTINSGSATVDASGTGTLDFTNAGTIQGSAILTLAGTNTGNNTFTPILTGGGDGLTKAGTGVWVVVGNSDYTSTTTFSGGTLIVNDIPDAGIPSPLGAANNGQGDTVFSGGALRYTGPAQNTNRVITLAGTGTIDASGTGPINFDNTGTIGTNGTTGNRTLGLTGSNAGNNTIAAALIDAGSGSVTSVAKSNTGKWILSGTNSYTGTTTIAGGTLEVTAAAQAPLITGPGNTIINSGILALDYNGGVSPPGHGLSDPQSRIGWQLQHRPDSHGQYRRRQSRHRLHRQCRHEPASSSATPIAATPISTASSTPRISTRWPPITARSATPRGARVISIMTAS